MLVVARPFSERLLVSVEGVAEREEEKCDRTYSGKYMCVIQILIFAPCSLYDTSIPRSRYARDVADASDS